MTKTDHNNRLLNFVKGRSTRKEYWVSVALLILGNVLLSLVVREGALVSLISLPFWLIIAGRRLHDFGARRTWALVPFGVGIAVGFLQGFARAAWGESLLSAATEAVAYIVVTLVVCIVIGFIPGSKTANRYGTPLGGAAA